MAAVALAPTADIVKATRSSIPELSRTMARAFESDPAMRFFFPEHASRLGRLERMFAELALPDTLVHEETYATADLTGGALWVPPGEGQTGLLDTLRLIPKIVSICGSMSLRALRGFAFMESNHPEEPHYYLWLLGVDPARQGQGIGTKLMDTVLERCDAERIPAYLEATSPLNRDLYLRNGFEITEEVHWPGGGPPLWLMWREPAGG